MCHTIYQLCPTSWPRKLNATIKYYNNKLVYLTKEMTHSACIIYCCLNVKTLFVNLSNLLVNPMYLVPYCITINSRLFSRIQFHMPSFKCILPQPIRFLVLSDCTGETMTILNGATEGF